MIHYVVVSGAPTAVERLAPQLVPSLDATRYFEGEQLGRAGASGTWAFAAIASPDPMCRTRLAADDDAMVVVNGPALRAGANQTSFAEALLGTFRSGGSAAVSSALGGAYNFVGVAPAIGLRAFADSSGLFPLYWREGPEVAVISNRSTTIARLTGSHGWDVRALAWVIGHANLFGDQMPARDVSYLPPGREAQVPWSEGRVRVETSPAWIWPEPSDDLGRDNLTPGEWDDVTHALVTNFGALRYIEGPLRLSITGGKDSRLCLALAKAAGLQDRIETYTAGGMDNPEVEAAAAVARAAGFEHRRSRPQPATHGTRPTPPPFNSNAFWQRLRKDVYRHEGIVCPWSGLVEATRRPTVDIKGFGGEFYRRGNAKQFRSSEKLTLDALAARFVNYHQVHDPLGILRRREAEYQTSWLKEWVHGSARGIRFDLLPEKFYVDYRLGHWNGPMGQARPGSVVVNPLLLASAARKNLELSPQARSAERFHFEVMRRAAPEVVSVPFLDDVWAPEIAVDSPIELPGYPYPTKVRPTTRTLTGARPAWAFLQREASAIEELFKEAAGRSALATTCKMRRLKRIARQSAQLQKSRDVKQIFSSIGAALILLDRVEAVCDDLS